MGKGAPATELKSLSPPSLCVVQRRRAARKKRWPAHPVKPAMVQHLEDLEEGLALLRREFAWVRAAVDN